GREYTLNTVLEVGQISENVTIVGGADVINASTAELSNTVGPRQLVELPLNGRNPLNLVGLQAGTSQNGAQTTHINGQRSTFTNVTRDGLNIQDNFIRGNAVDFVQERPSVDDTGEFTITTQNANADSGYGSSQIQLVTPRGESEFHGAIWEYNRNSKFGANSFFRNRAGTPRPFLNRNQFGGKIGGPALKDKVFFFFSYEGLRLKQSSSLTKTILLPDARNGIFTYVDNAGVRRQVNLFTTFGGSTGITSVNPAIQSRFFAVTPSVPNTNTAGDALNTSGYTFAQKGDQTRNAYTTRIDFDINDRNTINGVFSYKKEENLRNDATNNFDPEPDVVQPSIPKFLALAWRYNPTPSITNEVRGGHFRGGPVFLRTNPLPATFITPTLISTPETTFTDQGRFTIYNNFQDNAEWIRGNHSFRFGGLLQTFDINSFVNFGVIPTYTIGTNSLSTPFISTAQFTNAALFPGGISTTQRTTANSLLALLGGIVSAGSQTFNVESQTSGFVSGQEERRKYNYENISLYLADQWRVRPTLTLNLGVRYEVYTALRETQGLFIEPAIPNGADPVATLLNPAGSFQFVGGNGGGDNRLYNTDYNNFAPVVSFAWTPQFKNKLLGSVFGDGRTVIRGGYRMSYVNDDLVVSQQNSVGLNQGLAFTTNALNPVLGTTNLNARANALPVIPAPAFGILPKTFASQNIALNSFFATIFGIDPNLQSPRVDEYNFGIQREIGWQTAVEVRYVGSRSNSLVRALDYNQIDIRSNGFLQAFENARFNFNLTGNPRCTAAQGCRDVS
ncbi:MAG: TonB-dependent receptor, partial [Acidobacteriota bacterium]|nr:TonB-dependent receptor [Acidobacteriota bacterium]